MIASLSRRTFLQFAAAGSAATLPAVALAGHSQEPLDYAPPSDEDQLDACIAQLTAIMQRMRPQAACKSTRRAFELCEDGSWRLWLRGDVERIPFDGDGFYEISADGYPLVYYVEKHDKFDDRYSVYHRTYMCQLWDKGELIDCVRPIFEPHFLRKLPTPLDEVVT